MYVCTIMVRPGVPSWYSWRLDLERTVAGVSRDPCMVPKRSACECKSRQPSGSHPQSEATASPAPRAFVPFVALCNSIPASIWTPKSHRFPEMN